MAERTAEEWGRIAVGLLGWRWMPGMRDVHPRGGRYSCRSILSDDWWTTHGVPAPDDPATAGCLLALLGTRVMHMAWVDEGCVICVQTDDGDAVEVCAANLGRACIAAAEALGRWPGVRDECKLTQAVIK